jgi:uncharacterized protein YkwD
VRAGRESDGRLGWGGLRLAAELGLAAGVASAIALAVTGPASRLAFWPSHGSNLQLAGVTAEGAASLQLAAGFVLGQLPPPADQAVPTAYAVPVSSPAPVVTLPTLSAIPTLPALPVTPPVPVHTPAPTAPPTAPPQGPRRQPPAALGPGSATRAPQPAPLPVRTPTSTPPPPPPRQQQTAELTGPAEEILSELNQARAQNGLAQLRADAALTAAAVEHAAQIAASGQMSHAGYVGDVNSQGVSWRGLGEVLGANMASPNASEIDQLWMQSPEHRPIILDPQYTSVGIGWARSDTGWWYVAAILMY